MRGKRVYKTVLLYGEGKHEFAFLQHLQAIYDTRDSGVRIKVKKGKGSSVSTIIKAAHNCIGQFDKRVVKLDHDKSDLELIQGKELAKKLKIELFFSRPCLEKTLLEILEPTVNHDQLSSKQLKEHFEATYIDSRHRGDPDRFNTLLPLEVLEEARLRIPMLHELITLITTG